MSPLGWYRECERIEKKLRSLRSNPEHKSSQKTAWAKELSILLKPQQQLLFGTEHFFEAGMELSEVRGV